MLAYLIHSHFGSPLPVRLPSESPCKVALTPLPDVPSSELISPIPNKTIRDHPELFKIVTPVNIDAFEHLLETHPNRPLVNSVCRGLGEGFWPSANIDPNAPDTFNFSERQLTDARTACVQQLCDDEVASSRYSKPFGLELLLGMYSQPIGVVPKPHSNDLRIIIDQSARPHALNSWTDKADVSICLDNLQDFGAILHLV